MVCSTNKWVKPDKKENDCQLHIKYICDLQGKVAS